MRDRDQDAARWRALIRERARREHRDLPADVVDELASHLSDHCSAALRRGSTEDQARHSALDLLNAARLDDLVMHAPPDRVRCAQITAAVSSDVRYALRQLRRSPGFTATALLTLAIGIGANATVFTLAHAVLLKTLPVSHASELYRLGDEYRCCPEDILLGSWSIFSYPFYLEIRDHSGAFEEVAAMDTMRPNLSVHRSGVTGLAIPFTGEFVSGNYFTTLGVQAFAGRTIEPSDDYKGAAPVAVASYGAWEKYGFDTSVIGQPMTIGGVAVTLVGVTPPAFFGDRLESHPPDLWMPLSLEPIFTREGSLLETPDAAWLYVLGRLRPGARPEQVQTQLTTALRNYLRVPGHVSHNEDLRKIDAQVIRLAPGGGGTNAIRRDYEQGLYLLLAVSAMVLLIACANLANLLLVRGAAQRMRTAIELAMGASRGLILRRYLTESLVLSLLGGAAGLLTAVYATRVVLFLTFGGAAHVPIATTPSLAVLLFTFIVSTLTGVLFAVGPAWLVSRSDPAGALRGSSRVVADAALAQRSLVVLQAALSLVLVTVAGLLTQSLTNLARQPFGFEPSGRLIVGIDPQSAGYTQARLTGLYKRIDDRLSRVPGVISESLSLYTAQQGNGIWGARIFIEGAAGPFPSQWDRVGAHYFETIGTPILRGRGIDEHDTVDSQPAAVINETFARRYFANQDPIGRHFGKYEPGHAGDFEIVGVVGDAKYRNASSEIRPMFFVPLPQTIRYSDAITNKIEESSRYVGSIELHVHGDPDAIAAEIRAALADVDENLPPTSMAGFPDLIRTTTSEQRLIARLSAAFGVIALLLAAIGLYGVSAYRVAQRRTEIGLRLALGATPRAIAALVVGGACTHAAAGLIIGVPLAVSAARAFRSQLFGVSPFDVPALAIGAAVVGSCAALASALPARRATRIAPLEALRAE